MRMSEDVTSKAPHGFDHIVVVGLGLIGASLAAAISKSDPDVEVFGVDVDSRTCGEAISRGWVANACAPESEAFSDFVKDRADLVVLATPVAAVDDYLRLLRDWDYRGVITDTLSIYLTIVIVIWISILMFSCHRTGNSIWFMISICIFCNFDLFPILSKLVKILPAYSTIHIRIRKILFVCTN